MHDPVVGLVAAPLGAAMAVLAGVALGVLFYGGLWWTVRRTARFRHPGPSVLGSALLRMAVALCGFYWEADGDWARLLLCLAGFALARIAVTWLTRLPPRASATVHAVTGGRHAP